MKLLVENLIKMNETGQVLELCEKYYDENILMTSDGNIFAKSMREAYDKQKGFVDGVKEFEVKLISEKIEHNIAVLIFNYKITNADSITNEFVGKHIQTWENGKIIKEEYESIK